MTEPLYAKLNRMRGGYDRIQRFRRIFESQPDTLATQLGHVGKRIAADLGVTESAVWEAIGYLDAKAALGGMQDGKA